MAKPKSFLKSISIDIAKRAHFCQHNQSHAIAKGDKRLKLVVGRAKEYFCVQCAMASIERDIELLEKIKSDLNEDFL